jgi:deoxyribodipyrimidine photo-lyase
LFIKGSCIFERLKKSVDILWFKRDLRLADHAPLRAALTSPRPVICIFLFEPSVIASSDSDMRHWRFAAECLRDLREEMEQCGLYLTIFHEEAEKTFSRLLETYDIKEVFSHQEIGNGLTFERDKNISIFFKKNGIRWIEFPTNGIIRGLKHRDGWDKKWMQTMLTPLVESEPTEERKSNCLKLQNQEGENYYSTLLETPHSMQPGGRKKGLQYLVGFLESRHFNYSKHISKPTEARLSCSRLSPYLAWGVFSIRQIFQYSVIAKERGGNKRALNNFIARLQWHCHFIQKFESEPSIEFRNLNSGFDHIRDSTDEAKVEAWKSAQTGIPMVDACMRCVVETGYLNFRMRSMLVSFLTHHLMQPWQAGVHHLAKAFLDYEPGIHFPQFQMQAGTMGVNTIRIYNPIKQGQDHDPEGIFIKKWIPELAQLPIEYVHEPWKMSALEQAFHQFTLGIDYPHPIVDADESARAAREIIWATKKSSDVKVANQKILGKHTVRRTERERSLFPMKGQ